MMLEQLQRRMKRRKAALALSAGVMGMSSAAMASPTASSTETTGSVQMANSLVRMPASELHASESFKQALVQEEGVRDVVYRDIAGYPTVGVGHLVDPDDGLKVGDKVSYDRILDFLDNDLEEAEAAVVRLVGDLPLYQHEFDALVDLVYNVGEGNCSPKKSPRLNRAIAARDYDAIAAELDYRFAAGQLARGLAYRSERRARIFTSASYEDTRPVQGVVIRGSA
jgi:GH24 family phage-related lysozyme (muramidase)